MITVKIDGETFYADNCSAVIKAIEVIKAHSDSEWVVRYFTGEDIPENELDTNAGLCSFDVSYELGI